MVIQGTKKGTHGLYCLNGFVVTGTITVVSCCDNTWLWHMRMTHLSEKGLKALAKHNLLVGDVI